MNDFSLPSSAASAAVPDAVVRPAQDGDAVLRGKVEKAAVQFEGLFIRQMLQQMRRSADEIGGKDALFKGQSGNGLLDIADTMLADAMAGQRAFGIADTIVRQMLPAAVAPVAADGSAVALKFEARRVALPIGRRDAASPSSTLDQPGTQP